MDVQTAKAVLVQLHAAIHECVPSDVLCNVTQAGCYSEGVDAHYSDFEYVTGFKLLGAGNFAAVYASPDHPGWAFKVGLKNEDSGALYAAWCRSHQHLVGVPHIVHIQKFSDCYMVCMRQYHRALDYDIAEGLSDILQGRVQNSFEIPDQPGVADTARKIRKFFCGVAAFDMHTNNFMVDAMGQVIITDPVSFSRKPEFSPTGRLGHNMGDRLLKLIRDTAASDRHIAAKARPKPNWKARPVDRAAQGKEAKAALIKRLLQPNGVQL